MHFILLDGYRGAAALVVLFFHAAVSLNHKDWMPFGSLAVDFFYCLSGFVICHSYENRIRSGIGWISFMRLRLIRLYPMIFIGLTIGFAIFVVRAILSHRLDRIAPGLASLAFNALLLPSPMTQLANGAAWPINGAHWSLSFELLANALFAACLPYLSRRLFAGLTVLAFAALSYFSLNLPEFDLGWAWKDLWFGVLRVLFPFMMGVLLYWLYRAAQSTWQFRSASVGPILMVTLCAALMAPMGLAPKLPYSLAFVAITAPILIFAGALCAIPKWQESVCKVLGDLSYPLYAIHLPLIRFGQGIGERLYPDNLSMRILLAGVSCLISIWLAIVCKNMLEPRVKALTARALGSKQSAPSQA